MKQIVVVKTGSISKEDKDTLLKNGCIVIENKNPSTVKIINSYDGLEGDDIFNAAINTLSDSQFSANIRSEFATRILAAFKKKQPSTPVNKP